MIHAAHASRYHWGKNGTPLEFEQGEWQISRVYSVLGHAAAAIYHAQRCLSICRENDIRDFDSAFAYEALTRAYAVASQAAKSREYVQWAEQAAQEIEEEDDQDYFRSELQSTKDLVAQESPARPHRQNDWRLLALWRRGAGLHATLLER